MFHSARTTKEKKKVLSEPGKLFIHEFKWAGNPHNLGPLYVFLWQAR